MRHGRKELAQSSDIAFLLIIFFLLLSGLESNKALPMEKRGNGTGTEETCELILLSDGSIRYGDGTIPLSALSSFLSSYTIIDLTIEDDVPWQKVVDLFAVAEKLNMKVALHEG